MSLELVVQSEVCLWFIDCVMDCSFGVCGINYVICYHL